MRSVVRHLRSQAVAYLALFVALGGTGYAAVTLPAHSVGSRQLRTGAVGTNQLKNHSITPIKFSRGSIAGYVLAYAQVNSQGALVASRPSAHITYWHTTGPGLGGQIQFNTPIPAACFALVTAEGGGGPTYATAQTSGEPRSNGFVTVMIAPFQNSGNAFASPINLAVICPQP